jgi:hypothetical protein
VLVLTDGLRPSTDLAAFVAQVRGDYELDASGHRITPTVFGVFDGRIGAVLHVPRPTGAS